MVRLLSVKANGKSNLPLLPVFKLEWKMAFDSSAFDIKRSPPISNTSSGFRSQVVLGQDFVGSELILKPLLWLKNEVPLGK